jgi:hypothetical protein
MRFGSEKKKLPKNAGTVRHSPGKKGGNPFFKPRSHALPHPLMQNMESSFGQDFSGVDVQSNSSRASGLSAKAFTEGESIHFAPGQFDPGTETGKNLIGHELAHVVQQRGGGVQSTGVEQSGVTFNNDQMLEQQANEWGGTAASGASVANANTHGNKQAKSGVVQFAKQPSHYGEWFDDTYSLTASGQRRGVDMTLRFKPNANVNAELIGLTQTEQALHTGTPFYLNSDAFYKGRSIKAADAKTNATLSKTDEGTKIDRVKDYNNPIYPVQSLPSAKLDDTNIDAGWGQHGYHYTDPVSKTLKEQDAKLIDTPSIGSVDMSKDSSQIFETAAIATKGVQAGTFLGSVKWGWNTDAAGNHTKVDFKVVSEGVPSSTFLKAGEIWNATKSSTGADTVDLPLPDVKIISNAAGVDIQGGKIHLGPGARVIDLGALVSMTHKMIRVVDGPFVNEVGWVPNADVSDERS